MARGKARGAKKVSRSKALSEQNDDPKVPEDSMEVNEEEEKGEDDTVTSRNSRRHEAAKAARQPSNEGKKHSKRRRTENSNGTPANVNASKFPLTVEEEIDIFIRDSGVIYEDTYSPSYEHSDSIDRQPLLHQAAFRGDVEAIEKLLADGADIAENNSHNATALITAIECHQHAAAIALLKGGADPHSSTEWGSVIHLAARFGCTPVIEELIDKYGVGVDIMLPPASSYSSGTPLHKAAFFGYFDAMEALIKRGADIEARDGRSYTPLFNAAVHGSFKAMLYLEARGADIQALTAEGHNVLQMTYGGCWNARAILKYLISKGFDVNGKGPSGTTAAHFAAEEGDVDSIAILKEFGADLEAAENDGVTPLMVAAQCGFTDVVEGLINVHNVNVFTTDAEGLTAIHHAAMHADENHMEIFSALLDGGLSVNQPTLQHNIFLEEINQTPLTVAAECKNMNSVKALLAFGANTELVCLSPLYWYVAYGDIPSIDVFLDHGASISSPGDAALQMASINRMDVIDHLILRGALINNPDRHGDTALHWAAAGGTVDTINHLVRLGAHVNARNSKKETPLHLAARNGNIAALNALLDAGARPNALDKRGRTPMGTATAEERIAAINALANHGAKIDGTSTLDVAIIKGVVGAVDELLSQGASVNTVSANRGPVAEYTIADLISPIDVKPSKKGSTMVPPLNCAATAMPAENRNVEDRYRHIRSDIPYREDLRTHGDALMLSTRIILNKLLDCGASTDAHAAADLSTALHEAIRREIGLFSPVGSDEINLEVVSTLVAENIAIIDAQDSLGRTPLILAATLCRDLEQARHLLKSGANVHATNAEGFTALHQCVRLTRFFDRSTEFIHLLVEYKADVNATNAYGVTPLHLAAAANNGPAINTLIRYGANPLAKTAAGHTPLHSAIERSSLEAIEALMANGGSNLEAAKSGSVDMRHTDCAQIKRLLRSIIRSLEKVDSTSDDDDNAN